MILKPSYSDVLKTIEEALEYYRELPSLIRIEKGKVIFIGDLHGDIEAYVRIKGYIKNLENTYVVFLGDYVDRGPYSLEIITDLLNFVLEGDGRIVTLRGNHETYPINDYYGFRYEILSKFGEKGERLYKEFNKLFSYFPIGCLISNRILALHGGIPKPLPKLSEIESLPKGEIEVSGMLFQLLWNDPNDNIEEWADSPRGPGVYLFGRKPFEEFMKMNQLDYLVRAHLFLKNGFKTFFKDKLISIFSTINYVEHSVDGKILLLNDDVFRIMRVAEL